MKNDTMFSANGIRPWQGLGVILDNPPTSEDAIIMAGLDWEVKAKPVYTSIGGKKVAIDNYIANVRSDTNDVLGIVSGKYNICQNKEAFSFVDSIMGQQEIPVKYESAGSLFNGKKVWMLARMENSMVLGDEVENYLCFSNSHDGKGSIKVFCTSVRVVCNNTLQFAIKSAKRMWSVKHMGTLEARKLEAMETLGLATNYFKAMEQTAEDMYTIKVDWGKFLDELVPVKAEGSDRIKRNNEFVRNTLTDIYNNKDDLGNIRGTAYGAFNAVADFYSNVAPLRNAPTYKERKFDEFISTSSLLEKAQNILMVA